MGQRFVAAKSDSCYLAHPVPVMNFMSIVVSQDAAMIGAAPIRIDIGKAVLNNLIALAPDLFLKDATAPAAGEVATVVNSLLQRAAHAWFLAGALAACLLSGHVSKNQLLHE